MNLLVVFLMFAIMYRQCTQQRCGCSIEPKGSLSEDEFLEHSESEWDRVTILWVEENYLFVWEWVASSD